MGILLDDCAVAQRILDHIERGTTDLGDEVWREPVANYRCADRWTAERERVLRRTPTPFCPSAALPEPGSYLAREAAGVPLLVVREQDGTVRAFRNACRHRGMRLADGAGCTKGFACGYHGWTYGLDGRLVHVPHEEGFPGLDKRTHGLTPVRAEETLGLVFVTQDGDAAPDPALGGLPDFVGPDQELLATTELEIAANWKILLEGFLEGYHIRATHPTTFYPYGFDNLTLVEHFGRNSRVTFPFRRIAKLAEVPPADRRIAGMVTYVYHLFPNVIIAVLSHHSNVVVLEPVALDRTRQVSWTFAHRGDGTPAQREAVKRDTEFVNQTGVAEDQAVVLAIQRGLASGANEAFTYGRFEGAIVHFHRQLAAALGSDGTADERR